MRKSSIFCFSLFSILMPSVFAMTANPCIQDIEKHANETHQFLSLKQCHLDDSDIPAVVSYLNAHPKLTSLFIYENNLTDEGAAILAKNKTLENLVIGQNNIGSEGAVALFTFKR